MILSDQSFCKHIKFAEIITSSITLHLLLINKISQCTQNNVSGSAGKTEILSMISLSANLKSKLISFCHFN